MSIIASLSHHELRDVFDFSALMYNLLATTGLQHNLTALYSKSNLARLDKHLNESHALVTHDVSTSDLYCFDKKIFARSVVHIQLYMKCDDFTLIGKRAFGDRSQEGSLCGQAGRAQVVRTGCADGVIIGHRQAQ